MSDYGILTSVALLDQPQGFVEGQTLMEVKQSIAHFKISIITITMLFLPHAIKTRSVLKDYHSIYFCV
jgi:hypothetical protein